MEETFQPHRYLLFLRFILINLVGASLLASAYMQGWMDGFFVDVTFELSAVIGATFLLGLASCGNKIWRASIELNDINSGAPATGSRAGKYLETIYGGDVESRTMAAATLRLKLSSSAAAIRQVANGLVFLGLIGTVIGFIIALSGVDPSRATEVDNVARMIATLISGMSVAMYTTLAGSVLYVWLSVNHRILANGSVSLITAIIELGERRERL